MEGNSLPVEVLGWSTLVGIPSSRPGDGGFVDFGIGGADGLVWSEGLQQLERGDVLGHGHCPWPGLGRDPAAPSGIPPSPLLRCCHGDACTQEPPTTLRPLASTTSPKRATPAPRHQARRIRAHGSRGNNSPSTSSRPNSRDFPMHHPKHHPTDPLPRSVPSKPNDDKRGKTAVNHHRRGHLLTSKVPYLPTCPGSICIHHSPYATACVHVLCVRRRR